MAVTLTRVQAAPRRLPVAQAAPAVALVGVCALATTLRFANFAAVPTTPFYDAAVRSMGLSWHNFLYGVLDPSGRVSIDKPPIDLWLQVATTKLFGFSSVSLRLPQAIAGTVAVLLLYGVVRRGFGRWAGLAAALAFAVLPATVLTSRSDTMDTVMGALLVLAAWLIVRGRQEHRARGVIAAGAVAGLAFEVKLFESVVALPALALLAWLALDGPAAYKARTLLCSTLAFVGVASAWAVVASALPGRHPFPLGSTDGQIWNVMLVYNGLSRLSTPASPHAPPGILRLFDPGPPHHFGGLIGVELLPALAFGALALVCAEAAADDRQRLRRAVGGGLGAWLATGVIVASFTGRQWPRYLEAFTPAVAGVLGVGIVTIARAATRRRAATVALIAAAATAAVAAPLTLGERRISTGAALAAAAAAALVATLALWVPPRRVLVAAAGALTLGAALVVPFAVSVRLVEHGRNDAVQAGAIPPRVLDRLSAYLRAHQGGARYELAAGNILQDAALAIKDTRPVLTLTSFGNQQLVTPGQLARDGRTGAVHYVLMSGRRCLAAHPARPCEPVLRWVEAHGANVSRTVRLPHGRLLYRLPNYSTTPRPPGRVGRGIRHPATHAMQRSATRTPSGHRISISVGTSRPPVRSTTRSSTSRRSSTSGPRGRPGRRRASRARGRAARRPTTTSAEAAAAASIRNARGSTTSAAPGSSTHGILAASRPVRTASP
jgi:4-amino-4-deoxy-L-arabinose transferase-like glycosyltransferase